MPNFSEASRGRAHGPGCPCQICNGSFDREATHPCTVETVQCLTNCESDQEGVTIRGAERTNQGQTPNGRQASRGQRHGLDCNCSMCLGPIRANRQNQANREASRYRQHGLGCPCEKCKKLVPTPYRRATHGCTVETVQCPATVSWTKKQEQFGKLLQWTKASVEDYTYKVACAVYASTSASVKTKKWLNDQADRMNQAKTPNPKETSMNRGHNANTSSVSWKSFSSIQLDRSEYFGKSLKNEMKILITKKSWLCFRKCFPFRKFHFSEKIV